MAYFVAVPGIVAGLVPWAMTDWHLQGTSTALRVIAGAMILVGLVPLVSAFAEFAKAGGTPSPTASPQRLVVAGFNRYVRNPMYVGVLMVILGQAVLFRSGGLVIYGALFCACVAAFVRWYEEPTLSRRFGAAYETYRREVPAWRPRLHPWVPNL
ncbi:methyltransferase family protein [Mycobacterium sp. NPDC051198]